jgi:cardiolipin synthase A/B
MAGRWYDGNDFSLLENGEEFYPRVFERIGNAREEVVIETFILFEDKVGLALHRVLVAAARRGVQVDLTIDGWGSPDLSDEFIAGLVDAGVRLHVFDPGPRPFGLRPNMLRRMHRKIVVIDGEIAFIGGINYSADHLADYGPEAKQDYAVEMRGPIVTELHRFAHANLLAGSRHDPRARR